MKSKDAWRRALKEGAVYLRHVGALVWPGTHPGTFEIHPGGAGEIADWDQADLLLVIAEGRAQFARQREDFRQIQSRAQWLFTTIVGLLGLLVTATRTLPDGVNLGLWLAGVAVVLLSLLGAGAIMTVRGEFTMLDASKLSQVADEQLLQVAKAYASGVAVGENTVATRLTVFRDAVFLAVMGGSLSASAWMSAA